MNVQKVCKRVIDLFKDQWADNKPITIVAVVVVAILIYWVIMAMVSVFS